MYLQYIPHAVVVTVLCNNKLLHGFDNYPLPKPTCWEETAVFMAVLNAA